MRPRILVLGAALAIVVVLAAGVGATRSIATAQMGPMMPQADPSMLGQMMVQMMQDPQMASAMADACVQMMQDPAMQTAMQEMMNSPQMQQMMEQMFRPMPR